MLICTLCEWQLKANQSSEREKRILRVDHFSNTVILSNQKLRESIVIPCMSYSIGKGICLKRMKCGKHIKSKPVYFSHREVSRETNGRLLEHSTERLSVKKNNWALKSIALCFRNNDLGQIVEFPSLVSEIVLFSFS